MIIANGVFLLAAVALLGQTPEPKAAEPLPPKTWSGEEFRIVPVRVHLLRAPDTAAGTSLKSKDIQRIFRKANAIWHKAGVHLWVESLVEEKPLMLEAHQQDEVLPVEALRFLRPRDTLAEDCFHVYYIHAMQPNGIYMRRDALFVKDTARLHAVPGGIDEPLPRVTSHELGHGMGLPHRQDTTNLMASGTTGTSLNEAEIETARHTIATFAWVQTAEDFLNAADKLAAEGKSDAARSRYRALLELPNSSSLKAKAQERLRRKAPAE